jgi:hypothetical protein
MRKRVAKGIYQIIIFYQTYFLIGRKRELHELLGEDAWGIVSKNILAIFCWYFGGILSLLFLMLFSWRK